MYRNIRIFCDFDGTVTIGDVGDLFFTKFSGGKVEEDIKLWERGVIDSRELFLRELQLISVTQKEFDDFLKQQSIDLSFVHFIDHCEQKKFPVSILSDGMDLYIKPILKWNHLDQLPVYSNELRWDGEDKLIAEFPYFDHTCGHCANCKGYQIRRLKEKNDHIVFIGDGYSDICAIKEADTIFAKDDLSTHCRENKIPHIVYKSFEDIMNWFKLNL